MKPWHRFPSTPALWADALRFLLAGGANTLLTLALYQGFLLFLSPGWSYALCWLAGLAFLLVVYPSKVFVGSGSNARRVVTTVLVYGAVFALSWFLLRFLVASGLHPRAAIFLVLIFSTMLNFLCMRLVYRGRPSRAPIASAKAAPPLPSHAKHD